MRIFIVALLSILVQSCVTGTNEETGTDLDIIKLEKPSLKTITPESIALGDTVQIFGANLLPKKHGTTRLLLSGTFTDEQEEEHPYSGEVDIEVDSVGVASFKLDELIFLPEQDRIGVFRGKASLRSELDAAFYKEGEEFELTSETIAVTLRIKPSIAVVQLRSITESECALLTSGSTENQNIALSLRALGIGDASKARTIEFRVTVRAPEFQVVYVVDKGWDFWPINEAFLNSKHIALAKEGLNTMEFSITEGNILHIDPSYQADSVKVTPAININNEFYDRVLLQRLSTGSTEEKAYTAQIVVEAFREDGASLTRVINFRVDKKVRVKSYDQNQKLMERSDPVSTCGCFPGGTVGADLTYSEGKSINKNRSLSFRLDNNVATNYGISAGEPGFTPGSKQFVGNFGTTLSDTFGVDTASSVTSDSSENRSYTVHIIPGYFGACYRQVDEIQREVDVVYTNGCGSSGIIGQAVLTDWNFGFDISSGPECDHPSNLDDGADYRPDGRP